MSFFKDLFSVENSELYSLVDKRLIELNNQYNEEITIGQNYTPIFKGFISDTTHYKAGEKYGNLDIADLVYDDKQIYYKFAEKIVSSLSKYKDKESVDIFVDISNIVYDIVSGNLIGQGSDEDRDIEKNICFYGKNPTDTISIKELINAKCCTCAEMAGQTQNLMHFIGIPCSLIVGTFQGIKHAYNVLDIPFNGDVRHFIFDSTRLLKFKDGKFCSFIAPLSKDEYGNLLNYETVDVVENLKKLPIITDGPLEYAITPLEEENNDTQVAYQLKK